LKRRGQLARGAHLDLGEASALRDDHVDGSPDAGFHVFCVYEITGCSHPPPIRKSKKKL
jgi:hypothetical protein